MENLTKENCWDELRAQHPAVMERFCAWVDAYKARVGWSTLFAEANYEADGAQQHRTPKYHELPLALQVGIFCEFVANDEGDEDFFNVTYLKRGLSEIFARLERRGSHPAMEGEIQYEQPPDWIEGAPI